MKHFIMTLRYLSRERVAAAWIRTNLIVSLLVILAGIAWLYATVYLAATENNLDGYRSYLSMQMHHKEARQAYYQHGEHVHEVLKAMSERFSQPRLVRNIEELAAANKVKILSQNYRQTSGRFQGSVWEIDIKANGAYAGLKSFMIAIAQLRGIAVHEKVKLQQVGGSKKLDLGLRISVYQI